MNRYTLLVTLTALTAHAQDHHEITVFDDRIKVEITTQTQTGFDETVYWNMLEKEGWKETKKATEDLNISSALLTELNYQESVYRLNKHIKNRNLTSANALLEKHPQWRTCDRIQWQWLDLENETMTGYGPNAQTKYQSILDNCEGQELSTTQKLLSWTPSSAGSDILARYKTSAGYDKKFADQMEYDIRLSQLESPNVSGNRLESIGHLAKSRKDTKTAEIIAWKYMESEQPDIALEWFENAINWGGPNEKRIEGKLLSLQAMEELERLHLEHQVWSEKYPSIAEMEISTGAKEDLECEESAAKCLESLNSKPNLAAQDLVMKGWKLYELQRPMSASIAFEEALDMMPSDDPQRDLTQYGYVLALEKMGYSDKAIALAMQINDVEKRAEIDKKVAVRRFYSAFQAEAYEETLTRIEQYEQDYGKDVKLIEIKAWALYNSQRKEEAYAEYTVLAEAFPHNEEMQRSYLIIKCGFAEHASVCNGLDY
ncbi:hypothetical protein [Vibrio penaeicida]|uniref:hypothetical protein n=1 Tax=Vibrio penaeicida TaxID=104609 RepID=UPI000CEA5D41|nr:hypothetical protein [Vibrio penaeicida]